MTTPLKQVYTDAYLNDIGQRIQAVDPAFEHKRFVKAVFAEPWEALELKARMRRITETLKQFLPDDYDAALERLKPAAVYFSGYEAMFFPDFVGCYGVNEWQRSMVALNHFTRYSSSEFAVRPFIELDQERMLQQMLVWAGDENEHVRRLASEGCRPRLPWASTLPALKKDPTPVWSILETLKSDSSVYVRKSVANHLNDISKDHPDLVVDRARQWLGHSKETDWIVKHGCRTLLKARHPEVLQLFGVAGADHISVTDGWVQDEVALGAELTYGFTLCSELGELGKVRVELVMHFLRGRGQYGQKVFKVFEGLVSDSKKKVERSFSFKPLTTRRYYPGIQKLEIVVNGASLMAKEFLLVE